MGRTEGRGQPAAQGAQGRGAPARTPPAPPAEDALNARLASLGTLLSQHLGYVLSLGLTAFALLTISYAAHFDPNTAYAILSFSPVQAILLGVLLALIAALPFLAGLALILWRVWTDRPLGRGVLHPAPAIAVILIAIALVPWPSLLAGAVLLGLTWLVMIWIRRLARHNRVHAGTVRWLVWLYITVFVLAVAMSTPVWMPPERIALASGEAYTAYVLQGDDRATVLLRDADRKVFGVSTEDIAGRTICRRASSVAPASLDDNRTLLMLLGGAFAPPRYPLCPR